MAGSAPSPTPPPFLTLACQLGRWCPPAFVTRCAIMRRSLISGDGGLFWNNTREACRCPHGERHCAASERASKRRQSFAEPVFSSSVAVSFTANIAHSHGADVFLFYFLYTWPGVPRLQAVALNVAPFWSLSLLRMCSRSSD